MQDAAITELTELVLPAQANHYGTLFAGQALSMLAQAAFTAASRHARSNVVLAGVQGEGLGFETVSFVPIDRRLIVRESLYRSWLVGQFGKNLWCLQIFQ